MESKYRKVQIIENYADNGEFSHYSLIDSEGNTVCSEEDKEEKKELFEKLEQLNSGQLFEKLDKLEKENTRLKELIGKAYKEGAGTGCYYETDDEEFIKEQCQEWLKSHNIEYTKQ